MHTTDIRQERTAEMREHEQDISDTCSRSRGSRSQPRCPEKSAKSSSHYCIICKLSFASNKSLRNHKNGSRHRKKAKTAVKCSFHCEACCIELTSQKQLEEHLRGKGHGKRIAQRAAMEGKVSSVKDCERFNKQWSHLDESDSSLRLRRSTGSSSFQKDEGTSKAGKKRTQEARHAENRNAQVFSGKGSDVENQKVVLKTLLQSKMLSKQFIMAANLEASRLVEVQAEMEKFTEKKCSTRTKENTCNETFPAKEHAHRHSRSSHSGSDAHQERIIHRESTSKPRKVQADDQKDNIHSTDCHSRNATRNSDSVLETRQSEMEHCHRGYTCKRETEAKEDVLRLVRNTDFKHCPSKLSKRDIHRGVSTRSSSRPLSEMDTSSREVAVKSDREGKLCDKTFDAKKHPCRDLRGFLTRKQEQNVHRDSTSSSQTHSHGHKDSRNIRRIISESQLEIRGREGRPASRTENSNNRKHYVNDDVHSRDHYTKQAKRSLLCGSEKRQVHEGDSRGSTSTLHTERIAQDEDGRRQSKRGSLGLKDVQRNAEMRGIDVHVREPQIPTELSERSLDAQTAKDIWRMKHGHCEVDPISGGKSFPELKVGRGYQFERQPEASSNILDRTVVYDYNHGLDESLDEDASKRLPSSHKHVKTSAQTLSRGHVDIDKEIRRHKRSQEEGELLDDRAATKRQRALGSSAPVVKVKIEPELDDVSVQNILEHHISVAQESSIGAKRGPSTSGARPKTQPQRRNRSSTVTDSLREKVSAPSMKESGKCGEERNTRNKGTKECFGMRMLPLEHMENQRYINNFIQYTICA